jgi:hypothetical protein
MEFGAKRLRDSTYEYKGICIFILFGYLCVLEIL